MHIKKRDGRQALFNQLNIVNAVKLAMARTNNTDEGLPYRIAARVSKLIYDGMSVEQIQDLVLNALVHSSGKDVAIEYIKYRQHRTTIRMQHSKLMNEIRQKIGASDVANQNANVDEHSFGGRRGLAANELMREFALENCMSEMAKNNHLNNEIYIHDLDSYAIGMHNCLSLPLDDLLAKGFTTRQTDVRPANSINTAFQLVAVLFQLQSLQQFGGVSATHLDWTMVPYVRRSFYKHYTDGMKYLEGREPDYEFGPDSPIDWDDYRIASESAYSYAMDMTERELKQAVEGMYHNLDFRVA